MDDDDDHSPGATLAARQSPGQSGAPSGFRSPAAHMSPATPGQRLHKVTPASAAAAVAQRKAVAAAAAAADDPYAFPEDDNLPVSFRTLLSNVCSPPAKQDNIQGQMVATDRSLVCLLAS
jgi:hypothetical protein